MKKTLFILTALSLLNGLTGCGTIVQLIDPTEKYQAYDGIKFDWQQAQKWGLPILDLPLSFLLDTALLPYVWSQAE
ncbi:YceK/YidQ family lipoprotein [Lonepinella sp. BR2930]|uniref:YceK/YidQ family lipoprotein n=1 Tax=Lonepinella sp. BR2930 TaxID=3434554 RepID=UPI003F6DE2D8